MPRAVILGSLRPGIQYARGLAEAWAHTGNIHQYLTVPLENIRVKTPILPFLLKIRKKRLKSIYNQIAPEVS